MGFRYIDDIVQEEKRDYKIRDSVQEIKQNTGE